QITSHTLHPSSTTCCSACTTLRTSATCSAFPFPSSFTRGGLRCVFVCRFVFCCVLFSVLSRCIVVIAQEQAVSDIFTTYWTNLAKSGNPNVNTETQNNNHNTRTNVHAPS